MYNKSSISLTLRPDGGGVAQIFDLPLKSVHSIEVGVIFQASNTGAESLEMISWSDTAPRVQLEALGRPILDVRPLSDSDIRVRWRFGDRAQTAKPSEFELQILALDNFELLDALPDLSNAEEADWQQPSVIETSTSLVITSKGGAELGYGRKVQRTGSSASGSDGSAGGKVMLRGESSRGVPKLPRMTVLRVPPSQVLSTGSTMELEVEGMLFDEGTLQSLIPGHAYALRIRARTDVFGYTEWSAVDKHAVVVMPKIEDSDQPEAEAKGQTSLEVRWKWPVATPKPSIVSSIGHLFTSFSTGLPDDSPASESESPAPRAPPRRLSPVSSVAVLSSPLSPSHGVDARSSEGGGAFIVSGSRIPKVGAAPPSDPRSSSMSSQSLRVAGPSLTPLPASAPASALESDSGRAPPNPPPSPPPSPPPWDPSPPPSPPSSPAPTQQPPMLQRHPSCLVTEVTLQFRDDDMRDDDVRDGDEHGDEDDAHRWFDVDSNASGAVPNFDKDNGNKLVSVYVSGKVYLKREQDHGWRAKTLAPGATYYFRVIFASDELVSHEDIALGAATEKNVHGLKKVKGKPSDACPVTLPILFAPEAPRIEIEVVPDKEERWKLKLKWQPRTKRDREKLPKDYKAMFLLEGYKSSMDKWALGLKWRKIGKATDTSRELKNDALSRALLSTKEFTPEQWDSFNVSDLRADHWIKSDKYFFEPAVWEEIDVTPHESTDGMIATVSRRDLEVLGVTRGEELTFRALAFLSDKDCMLWRRPKMRGELNQATREIGPEYKASRLSRPIQLPDVSTPSKPKIRLTHSAEEFEVIWEAPITVENVISDFEISVLANGVPLEVPDRTSQPADFRLEYSEDYKCNRPGAKLEARVRAFTDKLGYSAWSPVAELVLPLLHTPAQPRGESAKPEIHTQPVALNATEAQVVWDEPGTDLCRLIKYEVQLWQCSASENDNLIDTFTVKPESAGARPPCRLLMSGLTPKKQYAVVVRAFALSEPQSTDEPQVTLTAESIRSNEFRMPWLEGLILAKDQQPKVALAEADSGEWKAPILKPFDRSVLQVAWRQPEHVDCDLEAYLFDLREISLEGDGVEDVVVSSRRISLASTEPSDVATTRLRAHRDDITGQLVTWKEDDQDSGAVEAIAPDMMIEIEGLTPGATYQVQLMGVTYPRVQLTAGDYADMSMSLTALTALSEMKTMPDIGEPILPWATPLSFSNIRLEWTQPIRMVACTIESYEVELRCHVEREEEARISFADVAQDELRVRVQWAGGLLAGDYLVS